MRGRPSKPKAVLKAAGTYRNDRHGDSLDVPVQKPEPQAEMSEISQRTFEQLSKRLEQLGVISDLDAMGLQMLSDAWEDYLAARSVVKKLGTTYESETANGSIRRTNPEVAIMQEAWSRVHKMLQQFGLTPSSRMRMTMPEKTQDIEDLLA
jgi:P27 family predicted phage terminase small subunit